MRILKFANCQTQTGTITKGVNIIKTAMLTISFGILRDFQGLMCLGIYVARA